MLKISDSKEVEELRYKNKYILLYFTTQWCPPCKLAKKMLENQLTQISSLVQFTEINCDEADQLVLDYKIEGVPTFVMLDKNLKVQEKIVGFLPQKIKGLLRKVKQGQN